MSIKKGNKVIAGAPLEPNWGAISGDIEDQADLLSLLTGKADANSATLTGTPTAPTPPEGSDDDRIATTAFLHRELERIEALPSQTGHGGQYLTTDGTIASWVDVDALPSQEGQSGKFLTTNGTNASWSTVDLSGKVDKTSDAYKVYGTNNSGSQITYAISSSADATSIAYRSTGGVLSVGTPTADSHATTKKYVDDNLATKLDKITYEWNKAISFGSTGSLCIGKFCCYDSNITVDIDATTSTTYHGTLVIATQNIGTASGGLLVSKVYGDATNTITPNIHIYKHPTGDCMIEVYFTPLPWSKNLIHIRAITLNKDHGSVSYDSVYSDICTTVSSVPAEATIIPDNALDSKQATLVSGTNIKSINNNSLLGSGNLTIDSLPSQSGNNGKFLTTNGTTASWASVDAFPTQAGNNGKFLTTDGSTVSWSNVPSTLPSQSGQSGKYLTTNGTSASWVTLSIPTITDTYSSTSSDGMSGKAVASAISGLQPSNTAVTHTASTKVGDSNKPVYVAANGTATACTYELNKSVPSNAVFTDTTYSQGTGISISGTTINHSNSVTAGTAGTSSATSGSSLSVPYVTYDAQGHITASGTHTHTVTGFLTSSDIDQTYSGTSANAQSGVAVKQAIDSAISGVYKPAGSVAFANRPTLASNIEGNVYNITDDFTTTSDFVEGTGHSYPAGTNIVCINTATSGTAVYKWDVLAGFVDLSGYVTKDGGSSQQTIQLSSGSGTTAFGVKSRSGASYISFSGTGGWLGSYGVTSTKEPTFYNGSSYTLAYNIGTGSTNGTISANGSDVAVKGLGSAAYTASTDYQATLVSGTNIKTINSTSLLGSGDISITGLPSQTGNNGKFLTTNGTTASWASYDESNLVHLTGDETITGTKSFESTLQLKNNLSFRSYGTNDSGRLQFRAQPSDNVIRGTFAITDGYSTSGSGYTGFVAQFVARAGSTSSDPFNTLRVSNKGVEYIKENNDGTVTGQYIIVNDSGLIPSDRLATSGSTGQVLTKTASGQSWQTFDALPSQSGKSGKFLTTNGTTASWADALVNTATGTNSLTLLGTASTSIGSINIGELSSIGLGGSGGIAIGGKAAANGSSSIGIGYEAKGNSDNSIGIGYEAEARAYGAVQIGKGTNTDVGSLYFGSSTSSSTTNNYKLLGSDGIIPQARLASGGTNGQVLITNGTSASWSTLTIPTVNNSTIIISQGGIEKGRFTLNQATGDTITLDAGGADPLPSQSGHSGEYLTTNGTVASWAAITQVEAYTASEVQTIWDSVVP